MALTEVVGFLNERLHLLHPAARLGARAGFRYREGALTATVGGFRLLPEQVPVVRAGDGAVVAWSARLRVEGYRGHPMQPEALYVHAWDAQDVLFLDRFLRTFHALQHINAGHEEGQWLVLGVHRRHVSAVPDHHGQVFQDLLERLGLPPEGVVLRLH